MPSSVCFCIGAGKFWPTGSVYYEQLAYIADKIFKKLSCVGGLYCVLNEDRHLKL
jgi:hypothetical protein